MQFPSFEQTWRWYGPNDLVSLDDIRQAGATGIVTALHHIPIGDIWTQEEIMIRKSAIEAKGLRWSVVESVAVHEGIKTQTGNYEELLDNYRQSIRNLAACGIRNVCYNFMPVLDWSRTDLDYVVPDGSIALRFDWVEMAVFDCFLLKRVGAEKDYAQNVLEQAEQRLAEMSEAARNTLINNLIAGLPGANQGFDLEGFRKALEPYADIDDAQLRRHLSDFLFAVVPVAEEEEVLLGIHPDDPPFELLALPRVLSTEADAKALTEVIDSPNNGLTYCTGSFGARLDNDLPGMAKRLGHRINFVHLRNTKTYAPFSFFEDNHLEGDTDMVAVMQALIEEQERRNKEGRTDLAIPFRPDHGHRLMDDLRKKTNPGYPGIGRLRGLAELRGVEVGLRRARD